MQWYDVLLRTPFIFLLDISLSMSFDGFIEGWSTAKLVRGLCILISITFILLGRNQLIVVYYFGLLILDLTLVLYLNIYNTWEIVLDSLQISDNGIEYLSAKKLTSTNIFLSVFSWIFVLISVIMYSKAFRSLKPVIMAALLGPMYLHHVRFGGTTRFMSPSLITIVSSLITLFVVLETIYSSSLHFWNAIQETLHSFYNRVRIYGYILLVLLHWNRLNLHSVLGFYWLIIWNYNYLVFMLIIQSEVEGSHLLACTSYSCNTFIKVVGLCCVVRHVAKVLLEIVRKYVEIDGAIPDQDANRPAGLRESIGLLFLSLYTNMTYCDASKRMVLLEVIYLLLISAFIRSAFEVAEPYLLSLSTGPFHSKKRHIRIVVFCLVLLFSSAFMGLHLYLLREKIPFSIPNIITIGQIVSALTLYGLYTYDTCRAELWEELDDYVYYVKGCCRTFEFILILAVLGYRMLDTSLEWSLFQVIMISLHLYVNIYLPLKDGWTSVKLRHLVNQKLNALPYADNTLLNTNNDVCAICLEELKSARVTPCNHIFHSLCLRKWLNVQNKCPMCHATILFT